MPTDRYSEWNTQAHTVHSSGSFTPAADALLVVILRNRQDAATKPGLPAGHGTWVEWGDYIDDNVGATDSRVTVWACVVSSSPGADTVDVTLGESSNGSHLHVVEWSAVEVDTSGGAAVAKVGAAVTVDALTLTLPSFADPDNIGLAFFGSQANEAFTATSGTLHGESAGTQPVSAMCGVYGVNTATLTVTAGNGSEPVGIGFELKAPSGAVAVELAGVVVGTSAMSARAEVTRPLAGVMAGVSSMSARSEVTRPLSGLMAGQGGMAAASEVTRRLAGAMAGASGFSAAVLIQTPAAIRHLLLLRVWRD